jgi:hypothetical protein
MVSLPSPAEFATSGASNNAPAKTHDLHGNLRTAHPLIILSHK